MVLHIWEEFSEQPAPKHKKIYIFNAQLALFWFKFIGHFSWVGKGGMGNVKYKEHTLI